MDTQFVEDTNMVCKNKNIYKALVDWIEREEGDGTWEPLDTLLKDIPGLVEDKLCYSSGGNSMPEALELYL